MKRINIHVLSKKNYQKKKHSRILNMIQKRCLTEIFCFDNLVYPYFILYQTPDFYLPLFLYSYPGIGVYDGFFKNSSTVSKFDLINSYFFYLVWLGVFFLHTDIILCIIDQLAFEMLYTLLLDWYTSLPLCPSSQMWKLSYIA